MVRAVGMTQSLLCSTQVDELVALDHEGATLVELGERFPVTTVGQPGTNGATPRHRRLWPTLRGVVTFGTVHDNINCMYMESSDSEEGFSRNPSAAWVQVAAIVAAVDAALGKWLVDNHNIGLTEYRAVLHLSRASDRELRITELAQRVGLNQSSVTRLVGRMEAKGLAVRDACPDDGRGVYAVITDRGLDAVAQIREPYEAKICELLQGASNQYPQLDLVDLDRSFETISKLIS